MGKRRAAARGHGRDGGEAYRVKTLAQVRALSSPVRMRILQTLAGEPRTTKQVADLLGEPATRLYHHVAALEKAGLVRLRRTRPLRGTVERYYQAVATRFEVGDNVFSGSGRPARGSAVAAILDRTREGLIRAAERPLRGSAFAPLAASGSGRVTAEQYERLRRRLLDLMREWEAAGDAEAEGVPVTLTVVLYTEPPENG